jgi:hypothetical protein
MLRRFFPFPLLASSLLFFACSSGPTVTTDVQHFNDAKVNLQASDFKAALNNLDIAIKTTNDANLRQQASVIRVALITALADAYQQIGEAYQVGAHEPAAQSQLGAFYKVRADYNNTARSYLMDAMQTVMNQRDKLDANPVAIQVPFPGFTGGMDQTMVRIKSGQFVSDADRLTAEQQLERNALARILAAIGGAGQDLNKGKDLYSAGKVNVDARAYIIELSDTFLRVGNMFDVRGTNETDKLRTVNQVVEGNLVVATKLLAAKPDKDLEARVKKMQADCDKCLKRLHA